MYIKFYKEHVSVLKYDIGGDKYIEVDLSKEEKLIKYLNYYVDFGENVTLRDFFKLLEPYKDTINDLIIEQTDGVSIFDYYDKYKDIKPSKNKINIIEFQQIGYICDLMYGIECNFKGFDEKMDDFVMLDMVPLNEILDAKIEINNDFFIAEYNTNEEGIWNNENETDDVDKNIDTNLSMDVNMISYKEINLFELLDGFSTQLTMFGTVDEFEKTLKIEKEISNNFEKINNLEKRLKNSILTENYEEASKITKEIKELNIKS
jgi:hypothetical protein